MTIREPREVWWRRRSLYHGTPVNICPFIYQINLLHNRCSFRHILMVKDNSYQLMNACIERRILTKYKTYNQQHVYLISCPTLSIV